MSYAISGGHQKTIEAAEIILQQGGNAVDAAIAAYLVSFISEPCMASLGAGGFAMVNDTRQVKLVDFFCQTPLSKKPVNQQDFVPIVVDFGNTKETFHVGKGSIAVPGAIAGIYKMHEIWGRLPIEELINPALKWAKEGIGLDKFQAYDITLLKDIFHLNDVGRKLFFDQKDTLKVEGDSIKMPQYADFLEALKHEGQSLFYQGEVAKSVARDLEQEGHLTRRDFEQYEARISDPISFKFFDRNIFTPSFPSVGGMMITAILNQFQDLVIKKRISYLSLDHFQMLINTFTTIQKLNNDPRRIADFLNNQYGVNTRIKTSKGSKWGGTSHFNVIDKDGMTVCLTTSIGEGSGYFIEGTDMQMNNMLGEEALMPNGFHNWDCNVRLQSMMSPSLVLNNMGKTIMGIGSGGAGRIPYAISQAIINMLYFEKDPHAAVASPRIHIQDGKIETEHGFDLPSEFEDHINIWDTKSLFFGGTNLIYRNGELMDGIADQRRFGAVINNF